MDGKPIDDRLIDTAEPRFRVVSPDATPDEVAAIIAAVGAVIAQATATAAADAGPVSKSRWVQVARRSAVRTPATRSEWRFSGRTAGRARA